jgi:hypothetical protein
VAVSADRHDRSVEAFEVEHVGRVGFH